MSKPDNKLFSQHEHALEKANEVCPQCGSEVVIKHGKSGAFIGCASYPNCQYTRPIVDHERIEDQILSGSDCPKCHHELAVKQGRYGMFIGCSNFPDCHHIEETHHHEDAGVACPQCAKQGIQSELIERTNRFGKTFYSCEQYPQCKYVVNYHPIQEKCPKCQWPILIERKMSNGNVIICPEKKCDYKRKAV